MKSIRLLALCLSVVMWTVTSGVLAQSPAQNQKQTPSPQTTVAPTTDQQDDVVRISTNLVQVDAVVTKDGKQVRDLKAEDFEIFQDGKRQEITNFAYVSNVPNTSAPPAPPATTSGKPEFTSPVPPIRADSNHRTFALVVDDLGLSAESVGFVQKQLRKFIAEKMGPHDLVAIIRTGGDFGALQQFTNDKRVLERAIEKVRWNFCSRVGLSVFQPALPAIPESGQPVRSVGSESATCSTYSALATMKALRFIVASMRELPGRKSMVVFSDSLPLQDQEVETDRYVERLEVIKTDTKDYLGVLRRIAEEAIRSSVIIYAVDASGVQYTGPTAADNIAGSSNAVSRQINNTSAFRMMLLQRRRQGADLISRQTGGYMIINSNDYRLGQLLEDQSGYYLLGYRPTEETFDTRFHKIKARVKKSGMTLRTRNGFYGFTEDEARKIRSSQDLTLLTLMSPFASQDIELTLTAFFAHSVATGPLVRSFINLDGHGLTFTKTPDGSYQATLEITAVLFGDNGIVASKQTFGKTLTLGEEAYQEALREGFTVQFDTPVKLPGGYQYRVAARDVTSSRIGSAGQFIIVPNLRNKRLAMSGVLLRATTDVQKTDTNLAPATRQFPAGTELQFATVVYNATLDQSSNSPKLALRVRLVRDEKEIYSTQPMMLSSAGQSDPTYFAAVGKIRLEKSLEPGSYYLQLIVEDKAVPDKKMMADQWVDFEVTR